jgi:hypothetical protein
MSEPTTLSDRTLSALKILGAVIAAVAGGLGIWKAVKPGPSPPNRDGSVEIRQATPMTLGQYLERRGRRLPGAPTRFHGTYLAYAVTTDGLKGKTVKVSWRLLTEQGAEQARTAETQPQLRPAANHDRAAFSTWVQDPLRRPRQFAIELDLYDEHGTQLDQATRSVRRR